MSRRIDKKTAHRRAAAPSIDFSMLPSSPEGMALREELAQLRDEERARAAVRAEKAAQQAASDHAAESATPHSSPEPDSAPIRSPYRGRDPHGRTLQPLDAPAAARLESELFGSPSPEPADSAAADVSAGAPRADAASTQQARGTSTSPTHAPAAVSRAADPGAVTVPPLRQSQIPTLHLHRPDDAAPLPPAPEPLLTSARHPKAGRVPGPTITLPADADLSDALQPIGTASPPGAAPSPDHAPHPAPAAGARAVASEASPGPSPREQRAPSPHRAARAIHEPAVTAGDPDSDPGEYVSPPPYITNAGPRVDRHETLVSQPPDAAFFQASSPIDEHEIAEDIEGWERRRWIRRLGALTIVVLIGLALLIVAVAGAYTLYAETATSPLMPGAR